MKKTIEIIEGKLSKKFFLSLPDGVCLASNCGWSPGNPIFKEKVVPIPEREEQWQRIKDSEANHRKCCVFKNESECQEYYKKIKYDNLSTTLIIKPYDEKPPSTVL